MKNKKSIEIEYIDMIVKLSELYKAKGETIESVTYKEGAKEFKFKNSILEFNAFFSNISHFRTTSESKIDNEKVYITKWYRNTDTDSSPAEYEVYHKEITY
jgi:hypothetical protein